MTVQAIRLENFMAFPDTGWIELRPICLLFGPNSSGKSVITRALRFLRQSLNSPPGGDPFVYLCADGVDVGRFQDLLHKPRDESQLPPPLGFHFRCTLQTGSLLDALGERVNRERQARGLTALAADRIRPWVDLTVRYERNVHTDQATLTELWLRCPWVSDDRSLHTVWAAELVIEDHEADLRGLDWHVRSDLLHGHETEENPVWTQVDMSKGYGFLPELAFPAGTADQPEASARDLAFVAQLLGEVRADVEQFLKSIAYLGPLRPKPERVFLLDQITRERWQQSGLHGYLRFLDEYRRCPTGLKLEEDNYREASDLIEYWLRTLALGYEICVEPDGYIGDLATVASIMIKEYPGGKWRNLVDVGFGVSQVLPIIAETALVNSGELVIVEQPELHLHPEAQAALADLIIDCARGGNARFMAETHSEHLLLRIQRRIAETSYDNLLADRGILCPDQPRGSAYPLSEKACALVHIRRSGVVSGVELVEIDHRGQMVNPSLEFQDFFRQDYDDVTELTRTAAKIIALEAEDDRGS